MITADTSVVVPGLTSWHRAHAASLAALDGVRRLPAHALMESFSVLTRLPGGRAMGAAQAAELLADEFPEPPLALSDADHSTLLQLLGHGQVVGGAVYDAVVGFSAQRAGAVLRSRDLRARRTYEAVEVDLELFG